MSTQPAWALRAIASGLGRLRDEFNGSPTSWPALASEAGQFILSQSGMDPHLPFEWGLDPKLACDRPTTWWYNTLYGRVERPDVFWLVFVSYVDRATVLPRTIILQPSCTPHPMSQPVFLTAVDTWLRTANMASMTYSCMTAHGEVIYPDLDFIFRRFGSVATAISDAMPGASVRVLEALLELLEE